MGAFKTITEDKDVTPSNAFTADKDKKQREMSGVALLRFLMEKKKNEEEAATMVTDPARMRRKAQRA